MLDTIIEQYENMSFEKIDLREATKLLERFENQLEYWQQEKELLFNKTQPGSTNLDNEIISGGVVSNKNDTYLIKIENIDRKINVLERRIKNLRNYIDNELNTINKYDPIDAKIIMLRSMHHMKWEDIGKIVGYSERQVRRKYDKYLGK